VKEHRIEAGEVRLAVWQQMPEPLAEGDLFVVTAGCDKRFETCRMKFANAVNFRGFATISWWLTPCPTNRDTTAVGRASASVPSPQSG
jgi:uncharacterized phage protein (TIGR02218 family)